MQQLEVWQRDPRPREDFRDFEALRQQLNRLEERIGQLEGRTLTPRPPAKPEPPKKAPGTDVEPKGASGAEAPRGVNPALPKTGTTSQ